ncbi:hypothetical protein LOC67_03365 [Stieleria sp. JC731]|uniref:hypothetical protein n=1 Tax=Pirellulaceae TaxID=2691357 RepID=UPI001E5C2C7D|nr:hypothetical protein [Stieleria sp. JC731]MCC9599587.1 hypothetical protein [Stieleria sp. JC731]
MKNIRNFLPDRFNGDSLDTRRHALTRLLWVAYAKAIPASTVTLNFASEYRGRYSRRLEQLAFWLKAESPLGTALNHCNGILPEDDTLLVRCGSDIASTEQVLRFMLDHEELLNRSSRDGRINSAVGYAIFMMLTSALVIVFIYLFILPSILSLFDDFDLQLPPAMALLSQLVRNTAWALPVALTLGVGFAFLLLFDDFRRYITSRRPLRWLRRSSCQEKASLLRLFAFAAEQQVPLAPILTAAAQYHSHRPTGKKLLYVRNQSRSDAEAWQAMASLGLVDHGQTQHLAKLSDDRIRSWALLQLTSQMRSQAEARRMQWVRVLQFLPVLLVAIPVSWCVLAVFQSLTSLVLAL